MRALLVPLLLLAAACATLGDDAPRMSWAAANYHCIVCGKGPLKGRVWRYPRGIVCDDCQNSPLRCSICGLPIIEGDGHVATGDGRLICRFDKTNCILTLDQAQQLFQQTAEAVVDLYGPAFALRNTNITVKLFDVDYWSERGGRGGLHAFGFASSRPQGDGKFVHEIIMLSGEPRDQMTAVAAHEYTHLWINENCPPDHHIDADTVEAICELTAYKMMQKENLPKIEKQILANPYTHGQIKTLVAIEQRLSTDYVLRWVKTDRAATLEDDSIPITEPAAASYTYVPPVLPLGLKFNGVMAIGSARQAVINGTAFSVGDVNTLRLRDKSVRVRLDEIHDTDVLVELNGLPARVKLTKNVETPVP